MSSFEPEERPSGVRRAEAGLIEAVAVGAEQLLRSPHSEAAMAQLIERLEERTGRRFDEARFVRLMEAINEQERYIDEAARMIGDARPCPVSIAEQMPNTMIPQWHRGSEWAVAHARRFRDEVARKSKLLMRALLSQKVGAQRYFEEKGAFRYDVLTFAQKNAAAIESEIRGAGFVLRDVDRWLAFLLKHADNYVHAYSLFTLFLVSAWLNRRPSSSLDLFRASSFNPPVKVHP